ncbi:MAG: hypothetical protein WCO35_02200 [Candidatus Nomurabacteria bacterium]
MTLGSVPKFNRDEMKSDIKDISKKYGKDAAKGVFDQIRDTEGFKESENQRIEDRDNKDKAYLENLESQKTEKEKEKRMAELAAKYDLKPKEESVQKISEKQEFEKEEIKENIPEKEVVSKSEKTESKPKENLTYAESLAETAGSKEDIIKSAKTLEKLLGDLNKWKDSIASNPIGQEVVSRSEKSGKVIFSQRTQELRKMVDQFNDLNKKGDHAGELESLKQKISEQEQSLGEYQFDPAIKADIVYNMEGNIVGNKEVYLDNLQGLENSENDMQLLNLINFSIKQKENSLEFYKNEYPNFLKEEK